MATNFTNAYDYYGSRIIGEYHAKFQLDGLSVPIPDPRRTPEAKLRLATDSAEESTLQADVCIVGAGAAGMYAAMLIDSVNANFPDEAITYDILEASDRVGGRLYTYEFPNSEGTKYNYIDVGAMRFPNTPFMERTFKLFKDLDIEDKLLPYKFAAKNTLLYYNGIRVKHQDISATEASDPFHVTISEGGDVPDDWASNGYQPLLDEALNGFITRLAQDMKDGGTQGWNRLMQYDDYSTRSYLSAIQKYPTPVINWLETRDKSTAWYDQALSETVLESMAFSFPGDPPKTDEDINKYWYCIDGGTKVLANAMEAKLKGTVTKNTRVTAIGLQDYQDPDSTILVTSLTCDNGNITTTTSAYSEVICTAPLPVIRTMNLDDSQLDYAQSNALRQLQYGPSTKIGMKFNCRWWEKKLDIVGGQSYSDRTIRTVVYPSYGSEEGAGSIIVSYAWTMDALRLGSLMENGTTADAHLVDLVLNDLAAIHDLTYDYLKGELLETYPFNWYGNPLTMGAFAFFGPGQFKQVYQNLTRPAADGKLFFAGEALSTRHAWVVGALDSAFRAVYQLYAKRAEVESSSSPTEAVLRFLSNHKHLGDFGEWDTGHIMRQTAISNALFFQKLAAEKH